MDEKCSRTIGFKYDLMMILDSGLLFGPPCTVLSCQRTKMQTPGVYQIRRKRKNNSEFAVPTMVVFSHQRVAIKLTTKWRKTSDSTAKLSLNHIRGPMNETKVFIKSECKRSNPIL